MTSTIDSLADQQAVTVLALVLDYQRRLPDPGQARDLDAQVRQAAAQPVVEAGTEAPVVLSATDGGEDAALARETLAYMMAEQPDLVPVVERAIAMAQAGMEAPSSRFDPVTVGVGALVVLALQTEVQVERGTAGKAAFVSGA